MLGTTGLSQLSLTEVKCKPGAIATSGSMSCIDAGSQQHAGLSSEPGLEETDASYYTQKGKVIVECTCRFVICSSDSEDESYEPPQSCTSASIAVAADVSEQMPDWLIRDDVSAAPLIASSPAPPSKTKPGESSFLHLSCPTEVLLGALYGLPSARAPAAISTHRICHGKCMHTLLSDALSKYDNVISLLFRLCL